MKKIVYSFIFIFSASIALPVFAAHLVPGSVPKVEPLQPAPQNVYPNLNSNVQLQGGVPADSSSSSSVDQSQSQSGSLETAQNRPNSSQSKLSNFSLSSFSSNWVVIVIILLLIFGLAAWWLKRS